jgi:hypothetical protein
MKTSEIILQGYRRNGLPYIDRQFVEIFTVPSQFITCLGQDMSCQLSSDKIIEECLQFLEANPPNDATIDKYYQVANTTLAQALSGIPKL